MLIPFIKPELGAVADQARRAEPFIVRDGVERRVETEDVKTWFKVVKESIVSLGRMRGREVLRQRTKIATVAEKHLRRSISLVADLADVLLLCFCAGDRDYRSCKARVPKSQLSDALDRL